MADASASSARGFVAAASPPVRAPMSRLGKRERGSDSSKFPDPSTVETVAPSQASLELFDRGLAERCWGPALDGLQRQVWGGGWVDGYVWVGVEGCGWRGVGCVCVCGGWGGVGGWVWVCVCGGGWGGVGGWVWGGGWGGVGMCACVWVSVVCCLWVCG